LRHAAQRQSYKNMSFTIDRRLEQVPSFSTLSDLAAQNRFHITGNEQIGLFSGHGMEGGYEFDANGISGTFAGHGVVGEFSFEIGTAAITITKKPFWLPENMLKQKITEGLNTFCSELA
jgi:hypothetical protein